MAIKTYFIPEVGFVQISGAKTKEYLIPEGGFLNEGGISYTADLTSGCTATASSSYGGFPPEDAIDDDTGTGWSGSGALPEWWQVECETPRDFRKLTITADTTYEEAAPKAFTLQASDASDMSDSVTLLDESGLSNWSSGEQRAWEFANGTAYEYYRITITATENSSNFPQMNEVEMMEEEEEEEEEPAYGGLFFCHG